MQGKKLRARSMDEYQHDRTIDHGSIMQAPGERLSEWGTYKEWYTHRGIYAAL